MGAHDGGAAACTGCGAGEADACTCVDHRALVSFLVDFSRATAEPAPEPVRPNRRVAGRREPALTTSPAGPGDPDGPDCGPPLSSPLPVWPPAPAPVQVTAAGPERAERKGLLRRLRP